MTSIVIAAHNEETVIGRCLDSLLAEALPGEFDIIVAANGCTDDTARVAAARPGVRVVEIAEAGKATALNRGDAAATGFPRIYLDADIVLQTDDVRRLTADLDAGASQGILAVTACREVDARGRPWPVRGHAAIQRHLPAFRGALFGRGVIVLSADGRQRFEVFPELTADDLFLDGLFTAAQKREVASVTAVVAAPWSTADLLARLTRVRRANAQIRSAAGHLEVAPGTRPADRGSWLRDVVLRRPWLAPAGVCYAAMTLLAAARARRGDHTTWERDESTRGRQPAAAPVRPSPPVDPTTSQKGRP